MPIKKGNVKNQSRVTVTIVLFNSDDVLERCFSSIAELARAGFAKVVAVDNNSPDNSVQIIEEKFPFVRILRSTSNLGFARGCNLVWDQVETDYWLLLNPDASFEDENGLMRLVEWMDRNPDIGAASPEVYDSYGRSVFPARRFPSMFRLIFETFRLHKLTNLRFRSKVLLGPYLVTDGLSDIDWVPGTAMIVRSNAVEAVGLLSDDFFMYGEDIEWCWRFKSKGWSIGFCKDVKVIHKNSTSAKRTWGETEKEKKIALGIYKALSKIRGKRYARFLFVLHYVFSAIEQLNPFIDNTRRVALKAAKDTYYSVLNYKDS